MFVKHFYRLDISGIRKPKEMFATIRSTMALFEHVNGPQFEMLTESTSESSFSLTDYADRYTTARDAYLEVSTSLSRHLPLALADMLCC